jgi:hypothetical protein
VRERHEQDSIQCGAPGQAASILTQSDGGGVILPPQIIGQPVNRNAAPGEIASFTVVVADASGVSFQWKFNGTNIPGATGDSLLLTNVSVVNAGQYSVVVSNSAGSVTSASASLTVDDHFSKALRVGLWTRTRFRLGWGGFFLFSGSDVA